MNSTDRIIELRCNIDDMTGEDLAYAVDKLMEEGAKDAFITPTIMKKGRPGYLLTVLADETRRDYMAEVIFRYTSTIGIRQFEAERMVLDRKIQTVSTEFGDIRIKVSEGYGVRKEKPEFEDIKAIADKTGKSLSEVKKLIGAL